MCSLLSVWLGLSKLGSVGQYGCMNLFFFAYLCCLLEGHVVIGLTGNVKRRLKLYRRRYPLNRLSWNKINNLLILPLPLEFILLNRLSSKIYFLPVFFSLALLIVQTVL